MVPEPDVSPDTVHAYPSPVGKTSHLSIEAARTLQDECLGTGTNPQPDFADKIHRACTDPLRPNRIKRALERRCSGPDVVSDAFGGGDCAAHLGDLTALEGCLESLAACALCNWANETDELARDCDLFDNELPDLSCP